MRPWAGGGGVSGCGDLGGEAQLVTEGNIAEASAGHRGACLCWLLKEGPLTQAGGLEKGFLEKVPPELGPGAQGRLRCPRQKEEPRPTCRCASVRGEAAEGGGSPGEQALGAGVGGFQGTFYSGIHTSGVFVPQVVCSL